MFNVIGSLNIKKTKERLQNSRTPNKRGNNVQDQLRLQLKWTPIGSHHVSSNNHCFHTTQLTEEVPKLTTISCNNECFYHYAQSRLSFDTQACLNLFSCSAHIYACQADEENRICSDEWNNYRHICNVSRQQWHVHLSGFQHVQPPFHHEMSYYRLQQKQPQQLTICLVHLSLQVPHEIREWEEKDES